MKINTLKGENFSFAGFDISSYDKYVDFHGTNQCLSML